MSWTPLPYVAPRFDVVDSRGKVAIIIRRPDDDDPGVTVLVGHDGEDEIHIDTAIIPALIDALRRQYREARRDRAAYERAVEAFEAERVATHGRRS